MKATYFFRVLSGTFLIAGTMIGAGMLGIPLVTAACGFVPACVITCIVWFFMLCTGLLFLEASLWLPDGCHVLSITEAFFGKIGRYVSGAMFIFLYYCLMIAYIAAGGPLLGSGFAGLGMSLGGIQSLALFMLLFGGIVTIGPKSIDRVNIILSVSMIVAWFVLLGSGGSEVRFDYLASKNWSKVMLAMPILFSAFGFHNLIPSLCTYLRRDKRALRHAIWWGSILPLVVYLVWQWLIIGAIPKELIAQALREGKPITAIFQAVTGEGFFVMMGRFFSFFAIATSVLGVSFSLVDFLGDGCGIEKRTGWRRLILSAAVFVPPFIFAVLNPQIFATALGVAGGFGEAFLNGLLPVAIVWVGKYHQRRKGGIGWLERRPVLAILFAYGVFVMGFETYHLLSM